MSHPEQDKIIDVTSDEQFETLVKDESKKGCVFALYFWASWAQPCVQMLEVFITLAKLYPQLTYLKIEAEELPEVSESFEIESVPTFIFIKNGKILTKVLGANSSQLTEVTEGYAKALGATIKPVPVDPIDLDAKLQELITQEPVMIFIKGSPEQPKCGFSRQLINILKEQGVKYGSFDILSDDDVRQGLKKFSNWPTYPQVYVEGELTGGLDIIKEMIEGEEFIDMIPQSSRVS